MKKIVTVFALALMTTGAFAQFNQGRWLAGGSLGFSATTNKSKSDAATVTNSHTTSFSLSPDVGYFIIDKLAVGASLSLGVSSSKDEGNPTETSTSSSIVFAPFARYYLDPGVFFQAQFGGGGGSTKNEVGNTSTKSSFGLFSWGIGAGYAYFLNDHVAIEPILSYQSSSRNYSDPDFKNINSGIFLNVGLQVYLGPRN